MSNPFASWTKTQADAHNARVTKQSAKEVGKTVLPTQPEMGHLHHVCRPDESEQFAVTTGARASVPNTRQFTNLVPQPSTDEEKLNKLERAWLAQLRLTHPAENIGVQSITLKLGNDCRLTPDFWTVDPNGQLIFWETKGFLRGDADVKLRVAARKYRHFRFVLVTREKGQWNEKLIAP